MRAYANPFAMCMPIGMVVTVEKIDGLRARVKLPSQWWLSLNARAKQRKEEEEQRRPKHRMWLPEEEEALLAPPARRARLRG